MVKIEAVQNIRPSLGNEFTPGEFVPRTEAMVEAYNWGKELHAGQKRLSGEPYFETHCGWVAAFLDQLVGNEAWTIAGLLHDAVEDRGGTLEEIKARFPGPLGEEIAHIVDGVTKLSNPRDGRSRELETLRKIAMFRDPAVFLVKLADKSHNILTLEYMPKKKRVQKAIEAIRAYGKLAGILNCYRWRCWLEDTAFPHAEPETYQFVRDQIDRDTRLNPSFINPMMEQLAQVMEKAGIPGEVHITVNGYWQAWQKLRRLARARKASISDFSALNDLISFRMVINSKEERDCYLLLADVNRFFGKYLDQDRFDDYIACPQNGYRALQVTTWLPDYGAVEIAIATQEMEGENLWGVVYAIKNKKDISNYRPIEILTPTGGARFLPEGSSVLDAVASIQQAFLLDKISAVKVNDQLARLSDKVKPGDVVEVVTSGGRLTPTQEWLNFSNDTTTRLLRSVLATESLKNAADMGRQQIKPLLIAKGLLALEDVRALEEDKFDNLMEQLGSANLEDFFAAIGGGALQLAEVDQAMTQLGITKEMLNWTTIHICGDSQANRPGLLAQLAGMVFEVGGNIARSVNDSPPGGGFDIRIVVRNLGAKQQAGLKKACESSNIQFDYLEIV
ncbi:MAG: HD domain-containing protein [Anaerolineaceae bacterium]|nr:HD domain-containing protein [Anaerolineaceae bacterium]